MKIDSVISSFEVASCLQSKENVGLSEQQQGYLFNRNVVIPHKTSQQAHARLDLRHTCLNKASAKY